MIDAKLVKTLFIKETYLLFAALSCNFVNVYTCIRVYAHIFIE